MFKWWKRKEKEWAFPVEEGQQWSNKQWGDTVLRILKVSRDGKQVRYDFVIINGKPILNSDYYYMTVSYLKDCYEPVTQSATKSS